MSNPLIRRNFIKSIALSGAALALPEKFMNLSGAGTSGLEKVTGENFSLQVDQKRGTFSLLRNNGDRLLINGSSAVNALSGSYATHSPGFRHNMETVSMHDLFGSARRVSILSKSPEAGLEIELHITLYAREEVVTFESACNNISGKDLSIYSLEPLQVLESNGGNLFIPGVKRCLTNGALYYDAGKVHTFGTAFVKAEPYGETKGGRLTRQGISSVSETVHSWWNAGFFSGYDREGLVLGYLENSVSLGQLLISRHAPDEVSFVAESVFNTGFVLKPGQRIRSDRIALVIGRDPYAALESYATLMATFRKTRVHSIINGWCNWFYTYEHVTEDEVLRNAAFAAKHLRQFGMEYIQVDEGYQRWHGDWEGNERFPHGMRWLADRIKEFGLQAGIWIAPFVVSEPVDIFQQHPDWFLKNTDGSLKRVGPWPDEQTDWASNESPKRYGLDITHPGAAQWLHNLTDTLTNRWGYAMIKVDFVAWSLLSADRFHDASFTTAGAYRKGFEIMRQAAGESVHILDCGPGQVTSGLIDSMRIELDQNYGYSPDAWKQYFLHSSSSGPAAAKRYYFHRKTWINDADHICINLLSPAQAQAAVSLIALTGGNVISGDRLTELDAVKLEMLKKGFPSFGEAARPVDLFDTDRPSVFSLNIRKPFAEWTVAGFFNADTEAPMEVAYRMERLGLDPHLTYLIYDFWNERFLGEVTGSMSVYVPQGAVSLRAIHAKSGVPQLLSTSRHVLQGAIELEELHWDATRGVLKGISTGPLQSDHYVTVYLPDPRPWKQAGGGLFRDFGQYSLNRVDEHVLRIWLHFRDSERISWEISDIVS